MIIRLGRDLPSAPRSRRLRIAALCWSLVWAVVLLGILYIGSGAAEANPRLVRVRHLAAVPNCDAARQIGLAPAYRGDPGYWPQHDRDKDGWACEPIPHWKR